MNRQFTRRGIALCLLVLLFGSGCSDEKQQRSFGEGCGPDYDCVEGLSCDDDTWVCTVNCASSTTCREQFGDRAVCYGGICLANCQGGETCPVDTMCQYSEDPDVCSHLTPRSN